MTFEEYWGEDPDPGKTTAKHAWNAAQQAERERIRARVMQAAVKSWHGVDLAIGVPYVRLKAFANALLEEE